MAEIVDTVKKVKNNPKISIDTDIIDMLKYDESGDVLDFVGGEKFLDLPEDVVSELSKYNRVRYRLAKEDEMKRRKEEENNSWKSRISIDEQYASPTERMKIKNPDPEMEYYLATPKKMHLHASKGYEVVPDGNKTSIGLSGENKLATLGETEYVLMQTTKANKAKIAAAKKARNDFIMGNVNSAVEEAAADGNIELVRDND